MPGRTESGAPIPDPALVVLVGASGSGKSTWAAARYRDQEIVSSDALRAVVGSGLADLDASADAFTLLEQIVAARTGRGLTTVVDTLGTDVDRRCSWLALATRHGLPAVAVVLDTPPAVCRSRNRARDRPVPARVLTSQLTGIRNALGRLDEEGWDDVVVVNDTPSTVAVEGVSRASSERQHGTDARGPRGLVLQLSRFPADAALLPWLRSMAESAEASGFAGLAVMDHLIQIPQVGRAWEPIPEPWVTLGAVAAASENLWLGTLVTPVTFRPPGITAKAAATLSALTGGRAFVGLGAGWFEREHDAYGLDFPSAGERLDLVEEAIEMMRALWAPGTKPYAGQRVSLPETTCYPRPAGQIPIIVGGGGPRSLRIAARLGNGCNVPADDAGLAKVDAYLGDVRDLGRDVDDQLVTVLDLPVVGRDRDDVWARVERLRGRTAAATFAARHHVGTASEHADRLSALAARGVTTVFVAPLDLAGPDDVATLAPLARVLG